MQSKRYKVLSTAYPRYHYSVKNGVSISKRFNVILKDIGYDNERSRFNLTEIEEPQIIVVCGKEKAQTVDVADIELNRVNSIQQIEKNAYNDFETLIYDNRVNDLCPKIVVVELKDTRSKVPDYEKWKNNVIIVVNDKESVSPRTDDVRITKKENLGSEICLMLERIAFRNMLPLIPVLRGLLATADFQPLTEVVVKKISDVMRSFLKKDNSFVGWMNDIKYRKKTVSEECLKSERNFEKYLLKDTKEEDQVVFKSDINTEYIIKFREEKRDKRHIEKPTGESIGDVNFPTTATDENWSINDKSEDEIKPSLAYTAVTYKLKVTRTRDDCKLKVVDYFEENDTMYELIGKLAEHMGHTLEQEVTTECKKLPKEFKKLLNVDIENQTIRDDIAEELFKLFVCTIDTELDDDDPAEEMVLVKLRNMTCVILRGIRDIVSQLKLLATIDHHINLIKVERDRAITRLLGDLIGLFRRSNIPDSERPKSGEIKRLNKKAAMKLLMEVKEAKGCGYRYDKLHIFVEEIIDQDKKETVESDIKKILLGFNISDYILSSTSRPVKRYEEDERSITHTQNGDICEANARGKTETIIKGQIVTLQQPSETTEPTNPSQFENKQGCISENVPSISNKEELVSREEKPERAENIENSVEKATLMSTETIKGPGCFTEDPSNKLNTLQILSSKRTKSTNASQSENIPGNISEKVPSILNEEQIESDETNSKQLETIEKSDEESTEPTNPSEIVNTPVSISENVSSILNEDQLESNKECSEKAENLENSDEEAAFMITETTRSSQTENIRGSISETISNASNMTGQLEQPIGIESTETIKGPSCFTEDPSNKLNNLQILSSETTKSTNASQSENIPGNISEKVPSILNEEQIESDETNSKQLETIETSDEESTEPTNPSEIVNTPVSISENVSSILNGDLLESNKECSEKAENLENSGEEAAFIKSETTIKGPSVFTEELSNVSSTLQQPPETTGKTNSSPTENIQGSIFETISNASNRTEQSDEPIGVESVGEHNNEMTHQNVTEQTCSNDDIAQLLCAKCSGKVEGKENEKVDLPLINDVMASSKDRGKWKIRLKSATGASEFVYITQQPEVDLPKTWPDEDIMKAKIEVKRCDIKSQLVQDYWIDPQVYSMKKTCRGVCIIISNKHFIGKINRDQYGTLKADIDIRHGTERDVNGLKELFTSLHFKVEIYEDLKAARSIEVLKDVSSKRTSADEGFVCVICSHGNKKGIYGIDWEIVHMDDIITCFDGQHCKALVDKPKLFLLQTCLGDETDHHAHVVDDKNSLSDTNDASDSDPIAPSDEIMPHFSVPTKADVFVACATHRGYVSLRSETCGSWFLQAVIHVLQKFACEKDLLHLFTLVNLLVARGSAKDKDGKDVKQASVFQSSLRKNCYFFPGVIESNESS